jgi:biopolymer transport protein TolR
VFTQNADTPSLITRVNVTPIIDVALVLVIILLVTAPLLSVPDMPVQLPEARARSVEEANLSVTLGQKGEIAIDRTPVAAADFVAELQKQLARPENAGVLVLVRADAGTPYTQVGALLDEARAAGAQRLAIATRQAPTPASAAPSPAATTDAPKAHRAETP